MNITLKGTQLSMFQVIKQFTIFLQLLHFAGVKLLLVQFEFDHELFQFCFFLPVHLCICRGGIED